MIVFDNVVDDNGEPIEFGELSFKCKVFSYLKENLKDFDDYVFCDFVNDVFDLPASRFYPHDKKVLIWSAGEKKDQQINEIKKDFVHIFANYYWDEDKVTSIPLGYNYLIDHYNHVPINERTLDFSFVGVLNRHRIPMIAEIVGVNSKIIAFGMFSKQKKTLKMLNDYLHWMHPNSKYYLTEDFNSGVNAETFCKILRQTKIVFAPKGWVNTETFRMYEAMAYGCVVITNELPKRKYYDNIPVIQVDNWVDGIKRAKEILKNKELLNELSEKSRQFYDDNLSPIATAKIIINSLANK